MADTSTFSAPVVAGTSSNSSNVHGLHALGATTISLSVPDARSRLDMFGSLRRTSSVPAPAKRTSNPAVVDDEQGLQTALNPPAKSSRWGLPSELVNETEATVTGPTPSATETGPLISTGAAPVGPGPWGPG
jgi:hypothetical protein